MLIVGLTGGIATGKSTVSRTLLQDHQIPIIDADILARQVVEPGTAGYQAIVSTFQSTTPDLLLPDGQLNRPALGRRIFNDDKARAQLNSITHPAVRKAMTFAVLRHWIRGHQMVVLDVPLLFEGGLDLFCGKTIVVSCSDELQMKRLMARDTHLNQADAESRVKSQMPITLKKSRADIVLENDGTVDDLKRAVADAVQQVRPYKITGLLEWMCPPFGLGMAFWSLFMNYLARRRLLQEQARIKAKL